MQHVREPRQRGGAQDCAGGEGDFLHTKGETVIVSAQPLDIEALKAAIADTGYTVTGAEEKPYEKKGFFSFLKH